jgi:hypothetical protein
MRWWKARLPAMMRCRSVEENFMGIDNRDYGPFVLEHGDVWKRSSASSRLGTGLEHICDSTGELSVAWQGDILLKVGSAEMVNRWMDANRAKFDGMREMMEAMGDEFEEIMVVRVPVSQAIIDEINLCVAISGRVARLRENLERIGIEDPSLFDRPRYPG